MKTAAVAFASSLAVGVVVTRVVRALALRYGAVDHALVSRKIHRRPVPRLGGVAIIAGFFAPLIALHFVNSEVGQAFYAHGRQAIALFLGGLVVAALGVYDDVRGARARTKLSVQLAVAAYMYLSGFRIDVIASPFAPPIALGVLAVPFTMLWIVGVINAMNLIDGLDGLAGGVAVIASATMLVLAAVRGEAVMVLSAAALCGAILGFLAYNFHPASIFMGDTGSMFLGLVLATTAIHTNERESSVVAMVVPIVALGLPIADTLLAIGRRVAKGLPLFCGDRGHIHHRLLDRGFSHRQTVLVLYGASVFLGAAALVIAYQTTSRVTLFLLALAAVAYAVLRKLGFINLGEAPQVIKRRRRNMLLRAFIGRAGESLRHAATPEDAWRQVRRVARFLGASSFGLGIAHGADGPIAFSEGFDRAPLGLFHVRYGLAPERPGANFIELAFDDGRTSIDRETEIAIELFCQHLAPVVARIERRHVPVERSALRLPG